MVSICVETSITTQKPVRIIPDPTGIVQAAKVLKQTDIHDGRKGCVMSTQGYMKKVVEYVGEDEDFKSASWVSATDYENANGGIVSGYLGDIKNFLTNEKLDQVVAIVKSCSLNVIGDLTVTLKDLLGTLPGAIHHKVIDEGGCGKDITIGASLILDNDTLPGSGGGVCGKRMLIKEEEIVKLMEEEQMAGLELQVYGNVTDHEMADEESLNLALEEEARQARAEQEWLDKCRMTNNKNQRLIGELEALGEQGGAVRCLDHMREIVAWDSVKLRVLEQLLARTYVGTGLKDSYMADMEENE
uniref:Homologous recombination OB-fold protein OB-fold domain-containing protein n=1 Tax=Tanacetum cinerariifolium TaxID=118510 RepID=A0A699IFZ6_TANCI|nr:hypothetical protein [Tanacetum cinerariifolium]